MKAQHPAVRTLLESHHNELPDDEMGVDLDESQTTSLSLARALAVGCLFDLNPSKASVDIWDPAAGSGLAALTIINALSSAGVRVRYRGQELTDAAAFVCRRRLRSIADAEVAVGNTLKQDEFGDFEADLVIVDAPWGMEWKHSESAVRSRSRLGAFHFGLPQRSDASWLFVSLALEKVRSNKDGGGRVAALLNPGALSAGGPTAQVRERIVRAGLLESVTRLPEGLAPNTSIPLYLLTFSTKNSENSKRSVSIADLQTEFTTERRRRSLPVSALKELEFGLRTGKPGPRNRKVDARQFIRRDAQLTRVLGDGQRISWRVSTYSNETIDQSMLRARYGENSDISVPERVVEVFDLNPKHIFETDSRELVKDIENKGWGCRRLSGLLTEEPSAISGELDNTSRGHLFVPTSPHDMASTKPPDSGTKGRVLAIRLDADLIRPDFLAAWLNSDQGRASRRRAVGASSSGTFVHALRSDPGSLVRWADELIVPLPQLSVQNTLASADEQLSSYQAELSAQREYLWSTPDAVEEVVSKLAGAFDDSLASWLDHLPYPIASAVWTAETAATPTEKLRAYMHAWEAIVAFHATVLLSAIRNDPSGGAEVESAIRKTLQAQQLQIERASFGTWIVIIEMTSKRLRISLEQDDLDEVARVRRSFGDLGRTGIDRLISKEAVSKFKDLNAKRNRWLGHTGYTSDADLTAQVVSLEADLRDLRKLLGNVWSQILLVRAGSAKRGRAGLTQTAEVAVGTRSPFATRDFAVGEFMLDGELYLIRDGSQSPIRLCHFVQLRAAPSSAQYTSYFYNRTEGSHIRMVSYQYGPGGELQDDLASFREEFGLLQ